MEGNPLYYLLLLEASATEVVVEVTDTCIVVEVEVWMLCCWFYLVGVTSPSEGGQ